MYFEYVFLVFVHVTKDFLHRRVADGLLEKNVLDAMGGHIFQEGNHQEETAEPCTLMRTAGPCMRAQHDLGLVLKIFDLEGIFEATSLCNKNLAEDMPLLVQNADQC